MVVVALVAPLVPVGLVGPAAPEGAPTVAARAAMAHPGTAAQPGPTAPAAPGRVDRGRAVPLLAPADRTGSAVRVGAPT